MSSIQALGGERDAAPARFLTFELPMVGNWQEHWGERLRGAGASVDVDTSDRACLLLASVDQLLSRLPVWALSRVGSALRAPERVKGAAGKLHRWTIEHWHKDQVRLAAEKVLAEPWAERNLRSGHLNQTFTLAQALQRQARAEGLFHLDWLMVAWPALTAMSPDQLHVARQKYGEQWDGYLEMLRQEVAPALCYLMLKPEMVRLEQADRDAAQVNVLAKQVQVLAWEAEHASGKHQRATDHVRRLEQRIAELEAEVEMHQQEQQRQEQRAEHDWAMMAEERQMWLELLREAQARSSPALTQDRPLPLTGQRVVLVGGDPLWQGAVGLLQALGAADIECCPGFSEERRFGQVAETADVVVAVVAYMSHKHSGLLKTAQERSSIQVIRVNHVGLTALRRALEDALCPAHCG